MTLLRLEVHPLAAAEARRARLWYAKRSALAAARFAVELTRAAERITRTPQELQPYLHGTRMCRLRRYPYLVVFLQTDVSVLIIAVAHGRRRPGYWKKRIP